MVFIRKLKSKSGTYLVEVESYRKNGKVKQRYRRYIGKEIDGKRILSGSIANAKIDKVAIYGPLLIIDSVAKQLGLSDLLGKNGEYLSSLAYAHCVEPNSVRKLTNWFERTDIHSLLNIPNVTYKKLLEALDDVGGENGIFYQNKIFSAIKQKFELEPEGYFYDVTNAYFYGIKCPIAKKKKKPKSKNQLQIQVGLAVTKNEGIPIFHRVFEGNIFDSKTLPSILTAFHEHKINNAILIWDRGVSSEFNISEALNTGFQVLCGLALKGNVKNIAKKIVSEEELATIKNRIRLKSTTFYAKKISYEYKGIKGKLVICLNQKQKQQIKEKRYDEIAKAQELISQKKKPDTKIQKYLKTKKPNYKTIKEAETLDGISAIFCTKNKPTTNEIIHAYFEKDRVERAFRTMKGLLEMDKIRFWLTGKVKAHIFICYLSYLLLSLLDYKLKTTNINSTNALEIMRSMYKIYITDPKTKNKFTKTVTLSTQQENILKAIDKNLLKT